MKPAGMKPPTLRLERSKDVSHCYGCGLDNPLGLHLKFDWDGKTARSEFTAGENHQGWAGIVHGGLICTLLDETMGYVSWYKGLDCVTAKFEARLRCPARIGRRLLLSGSVIEESRRLLRVGATIAYENGEVVAEGTGLMYVGAP